MRTDPARQTARGDRNRATSSSAIAIVAAIAISASDTTRDLRHGPIENPLRS
jgi:hypothetical protein